MTEVSEERKYKREGASQTNITVSCYENNIVQWIGKIHNNPLLENKRYCELEKKENTISRNKR